VTLAPAPWRGPAMAGVEAFWIEAADGVRLRATRWPCPAAQGAILLLGGRSEYAEKYAPRAAELGAAGYEVATVDWRGQGLSDRLSADPAIGHVGRFADYRRDLEALAGALQAGASGSGGIWAPDRRFVLAHSMGGLVALVALATGFGAAAVAFSAPMWGLTLPPRTARLAEALAAAASEIGMGARPAPFSRVSRAGYVASAPFENNALTRDSAEFARMKAAVQAEPRLGLGPPSLSWMAEALGACRRAAALPCPGMPALTLIGSGERVVSVAAIRARMARWPGARLVEFEGARHEVLMELPEVRNAAIAAIADHFASAARRGVMPRPAGIDATPPASSH
jgi:lysophospholipase